MLCLFSFSGRRTNSISRCRRAGVWWNSRTHGRWSLPFPAALAPLRFGQRGRVLGGCPEPSSSLSHIYYYSADFLLSSIFHATLTAIKRHICTRNRCFLPIPEKGSRDAGTAQSKPRAPEDGARMHPQDQPQLFIIQAPLAARDPPVLAQPLRSGGEILILSSWFGEAKHQIYSFPLRT